MAQVVAPIALDINTVLGDPAWAAAGTVFAGLALVITFVYRRRRSRKLLARSIDTLPVVSVHADAADKVSLLIEGREVETAHLLNVELANLGTMPIRESDFERPIAINLGPRGSALDIQFSNLDPPDLQPHAWTEGNLIYLQPLLLNSGDSLSLKALVQDLDGDPKLEARVAGVPRLVDFGSWETMTLRQRARALSPALMATAALVLAVAGMILTVLALKSRSDFTVRLKNGLTYCAEELTIEPRVMHLKLSGTGEIRSISLNSYESIDPESC
jgi:hypothetical protein